MDKEAQEILDAHFDEIEKAAAARLVSYSLESWRNDLLLGRPATRAEALQDLSLVKEAGAELSPVWCLAAQVLGQEPQKLFAAFEAQIAGAGPARRLTQNAQSERVALYGPASKGQGRKRA